MSSNVLGVIAAMAELAQQEPLNLPKKSQKPVVTLSRDFGSGGDIIAERLAQRLGAHLYDKDVIAEVARRSKEHPAIVQFMDEEAAAAKDMWLYRFFSGSSLSPEAYRDSLLMVVNGLGKLGGVIVGHGAHVLLADACALRVRITGSVDVCARRMAAEGHGDAVELELRAVDVNKKRGQFVWDLFKSRIADASQFDIVINTDRMDDFEDLVDVLHRMAVAIHEGRVLRGDR